MIPKATSLPGLVALEGLRSQHASPRFGAGLEAWEARAGLFKDLRPWLSCVLDFVLLSRIFLLKITREIAAFLSNAEVIGAFLLNYRGTRVDEAYEAFPMSI